MNFAVCLNPTDC